MLTQEIHNQHYVISFTTFQTSNKTTNNKLVFFYFYVKLYLLEDSGADEDSNMASLVFLVGREGLYTHTQNESDPYY